MLREIREKSHKSARFTVITGRRRIGKTTLVLHAVGAEEESDAEKDLFLYFFVSRKAEKDLCQGFIHEIEAKTGMAVLGDTASFADIFRYLMRLSQERPLTLFIDEFQDFVFLHGIGLVDNEDDRRIDFLQDLCDMALSCSDEVARLYQPENHIDFF